LSLPPNPSMLCNMWNLLQMVITSEEHYSTTDAKRFLSPKVPSKPGWKLVF
jgi:hypothetical protein